MNAKDALGQQGEQLAAEYLQRAGFRVLARNWRCSEGEIDIVAADRRTLVACEVKTRSGTRYGTPLEAVTRKKLSRLRRLAVRWVLANGVLFDEVRVDVVEVLKDERGDFAIEHIRGVGQMSLARTHSIALVGVEGHPVEIEADIENGLVGLLLVGLPDTALREARDRIRLAIVNSQEKWPYRKD